MRQPPPPTANWLVVGGEKRISTGPLARLSWWLSALAGPGRGTGNPSAKRDSHQVNLLLARTNQFSMMEPIDMTTQRRSAWGNGRIINTEEGNGVAPQ